jgi:hypothetical protein
MNEECKTPLQKYITMKQKSREASENRYVDESRKRLDRIITQKMNTTFIGAISAFEKNFNFLWGAGKKESEMTDEEKHLYNIWQGVRTEILNNGNNQLRALRNELQNHNVSWNRHTITIKAKEENNDRD